MKLTKPLIASVLVSVLVAPSLTAAAVRPTIKPVLAQAKQDRSLVARNSPRTGAKLDRKNDLFLAALGPLALAVAAVAVFAVAAVAASGSDDGEVSPG